MQCPECKSNHINKNGREKGKQNYICVNCGRQFIDCYENQRGYSEEVKREYLKMYVNGMGFRGIERVKNVHHTTIISWVKQVGELLPDYYDPETMLVICLQQHFAIAIGIAPFPYHTQNQQRL